MKHFLLGAAALAVAASFATGPARADDRFPWCAVISMGRGSVYWDCQYRTVEECVPNVLAGNRGTCSHNPRWDGWYTTKKAPKSHKKRHAPRH